MDIKKKLDGSPILVIGESYFKSYDSEYPFLDSQSSVAVLTGFQISAPKEFSSPDLIEIRLSQPSEYSEETISEILSDIHSGNYSHVVFLGRNSVKQIYPSLAKDRSLIDMANSPFLTPQENENVQVGVLNHYKSAFNSEVENALEDYWDQIKTKFEEKPRYYCEDNKVESEEEFIDLLNFLDTLPEEKIIGLDYETNAVNQFNKDFQVTMYGLAYTIDKHNAVGFWYHPPKNKPLSEKALNRWTEFLEKNHNRMWAYNVPFEMKTTWDQTGKYFKMHDVMVLMTMQGKRGSLKNVMRSELGASLWESSVHDFMTITEAMFKFITKHKEKNLILEHIKNQDLESLKSIHWKFEEWFDQILEDYEEKDLIHALENYPYPWASVPPQVLGPYCAKDAGFALLLKENFDLPEYRDAYDFCIVHPWLACKFEVNGYPWNDEEARKLEKEFSQQMLDCLYNVISNLPTVTLEEKLKAKDIYFKELPYEIITYTEKTRKEKKRLVSTNLDKVEELKQIFNPGSNTADSRGKFWDGYLTDEISMGTIMNIFMEDMELNQSLKPLFELVGDEWIKSNSVNTIVEKISSPDDFIDDKKLCDQVKRSFSKAIDSYPEYIGKFASDIIKFQYQVHTRWMGLKISDRSTWTKEWELLFNLFLYKKIAKTLSTNINGRTGRDEVYEVVGEKAGKPLLGTAYWDMKEVEGKEFKAIANFNSLSADTLRWTSGFHTISAGSPMRSILVPKEKNMVMIHADYSQLEVCVIAFMSGATSMIEALLAGKDMHRFVASKAFGKPESEITSEERRFAKAITFGLLYGKSVESLAVDITHGDVRKAQELFDLYFTAFPEIKIWIDKKHKEIDEKKDHVLGFFGNKLMINPNQAGNGARRNAQNSPIQNGGSLIVGTCMYNFSEACEERGIESYPFGFTHDAYDDITPVDSIIEYLDLMQEILVDQPKQGMGIPLAIDCEIGTTSLDMCSFKIMNRDNNAISIQIGGTKEANEKLIEAFKLSKRYSVENIEIIGEPESEDYSYEELFTVGKALKYEWGKSITTQKMKMDFVYR